MVEGGITFTNKYFLSKYIALGDPLRDDPPFAAMHASRDAFVANTIVAEKN